MTKRGSKDSRAKWPDWSQQDPSRLSWRRHPLDDREQLIAEILELLMTLEDTNRLDEQTLELIETLPWNQLHVLHHTLSANNPEETP